MAKFLVTGGSGFIGSNIVDELLRRGEQVTVLDNLSTGRESNLEAAHGRIAFHKLDIRDLDHIRPAFKGQDFVIHLAALASVPRSVADPITSNAVNLNGTLNVLVAARDAKVKRLVFSASSAAYGDNPVLPRVETHAPQPLSPYALTKLAGEYYCGMFTSLYGLETVALRYFNIFGPRQDPESPYTGVLSIFISDYLRGKVPTIFGDGEQSRDFIFVEDTVDATLRACVAPHASGMVVNVGTGERNTLNGTISLLNKIFSRNIKANYAPVRAGDVRESHADISLAREVLGFEPRTRYEEGLRRTVEWYRTALA